MTTHGIHHVTAVSGEPAETLRFHGGVLGLRLVKRTVNFDDPGSWHLYFGDRTGAPGSILTFFPFPGGLRGRVGTGQVGVTRFAAPSASFGYWMERLGAHGVAFDRGEPRFGERTLEFRDRDGMPLEIVATPRADAVPGWEGTAGVPAEHALRGIHGITLWADGPSPGTDALLTGALGFRAAGEEGGTRRFVTDAPVGGVVDVRDAAGFWRGLGGVGTVHHVAFRAADDVAQAALRERLLRDGHHVTPVQERQYFRSIYFREPGGVLFEVATDPPGFLLDEPEATLGEALRLPPWLEPHRDTIAKALPPLHPALAAGHDA
jgi:glyoxalase family protein